MNPFFEKVVSDYTGEKIRIRKAVSASGGCINNAVYLNTTEGDFFLKWNSGMPSDMFEAEKKGLEILLGAAEIKVPVPLYYGHFNGKDFLLMEYLDQGSPSETFWNDFGRSLAALHRHTHSYYGLDHDNYIGRLPQKNKYNTSWITFFIEQRIMPQLKLAQDKGLIEASFVFRFDNLFRVLEDIFPEEPPALLHGDLWSGNFLCGKKGKACLIDPAVYYGSREMEMAFTNLFGGFDEEFYAAYHNYYPFQPGFHERIDIYNLYPLLVHVNLFGTSYLPGVRSVINRF